MGETKCTASHLRHYVSERQGLACISRRMNQSRRLITWTAHCRLRRFKGRLLRFPAAFPFNSEEIYQGEVTSVSTEFTLLVLSPLNIFADVAIINGQEEASSTNLLVKIIKIIIFMLRCIEYKGLKMKSSRISAITNVQFDF